MFFFSKKKAPSPGRDGAASYDPARQEPAMRCSICTGEQVAGFIDRATGAFTEIMLIRSNADLDAFCSEYGIKKDDVRKFY